MSSSSSDGSNAAESDDDEFFATVLDELPPVRGAFAYGSAVFGQRGYTVAQRRSAMVDLIVVVDNTVDWHAANISGGNASHYSAIGRGLGIEWLQPIGGGMYYNHAHLRGRLVKYGVIGRDALLDDLRTWSSLYAGGRLHKPVRTLTPWPSDVAPLVDANLRSALEASLLLLPARFEAAALFRTICGLSYDGDVRMGIGESGRKPANIAAGQEGALAELYGPSITALEEEARLLTYGEDVEMVSQDVSLSSRLSLLSSLPSHVQQTLLLQLRPERANEPLDAAHYLDEAARDLWRSAPNEQEANKRLSAALRSSLFRIVRRSSLAQTVKGIATAGLGTSIAYAISKIRKRRVQDRG